MADYTQCGKDATKGIYKDINDMLNGDATKTVTHKVVSDEKDPLQKDVAEALNSKLDALNRKINEMEIDNAISGLTYDDLIEAAFDESDIEGSEADEDLDDEDLDDEDEDSDDSDEMGTITVDLPDDVDPSDVTVNIDGEEYSAGDDELDVNTDEDIDAPEITVDLPDHVDPSDVAVNIDGDNYIVDPDSIDNDDSDFDLVEDDDSEDDEEDADDIAEGVFGISRYARLFESDKSMGDDEEEDEYIGDEDADDGDLDDDEEIPEEGDDDLDEDDEDEDEDLEETVKMIKHHLYLNGKLYEGDMADDDEDYVDDDEDVDDSDLDDDEDYADEDVDDSDLDDDEDYDDEDVDDSDVDDEDYADEDDIDEEDEASDEIEEAINVLRRHGFIVESDGDFDMEPGDMTDTASDALDDVRDALESEDEIIIDGGDGGVDDDGTIDTVSDPVNESEVAPVSSNGKNADEMQGDKLTDDEDADDDSYEDEDSDEDVDDGDDSSEDEESDEDTEVQTAEAIDILLNKYLGKKVSLRESAYATDYLIDRYLGECKGKKKAKKKLVKGKKGRRKVAEGNYGLNAGMTIDTAGWNPYRTNTYLNSDKYFSRDGYTTKISAGNSKSNAVSGVAEGMTNRFTIYTDDLNQAIKPLAEVVTTRNNLPLAENVSNWNASKASAYIRKNAWKNPARANLALMRATHLYFVNEGTKPEDYQFPIATVIRGKVYAVPQAIEEAAALFASPIYTKKFNESTLTAIREVIDFYMNKMGKRTAWQEGTCVNINEGTNLTMLIRKSVYDPYKIAEMEYIKDKERKAQELLRD